MAAKQQSPAGRSQLRDEALIYAFGGIACMTAACVTNPVDVVKTRLQIQGELGRGGAEPKFGMLSGTARLVQTEGIRALYKGLLPSLLREASYSTIRMGAYESFKHRLFPDHVGELPVFKKFIAAGLSGALGAAIANPTDLVKVRIQAHTGDKLYSSTWGAFKEVHRVELPSYDTFKHYVLDKGWLPEGRTLHFVSSMFAGFMCALTTAPIDNIKTRVMNQPVGPDGIGLVYKNSWDCTVQTYRTEGIRGLYKGFWPQWLRIGPHTIVAFVVLEQLRRLAGMDAI